MVSKEGGMAMKAKVMLITPPYHAGILESAGRWLNLAFVYLAGHLRAAGFEPIYYDAMTSGDSLSQIRRRIETEKPDFVATTAYTSSIYAALEVLRVAKEVNPQIRTIIGGVHAHFQYAEVLTQPPGAGYVDFVVRGEGEITLAELITCLVHDEDPDSVRGLAYLRDGQVRLTPARPFISDLDSLIPAWDLVDWDLYTFFPLKGSRLAIINTSRGCPHGCTFCSQQKFWSQSYRQRRADLVVDEILYLNSKYGVNVFMFSDEYPTYDARRWEEILDRLIRLDLGIHILLETRVNDIIRDREILWKYRKAGVLHIYVGVEATNQESLDTFKKDVTCQNCVEAIRLINDHGMVSECSFIIGLPNETEATIRQTLELAKYYNPDLPHFLHLAVWPYADNAEELQQYVVTRDYAKYNFINPIIKPINMSLAEIEQALIGCYRDFYLDKVRQYRRLPDEFKRNYLLTSLKMMMQNSFLKQYLKESGEMPESIREVFENAC